MRGVRVLLWLSLLLAPAAGAAEPKTAPYGAWASPITAASIGDVSTRMRDVRVDGGWIY
jgi:hypothetical protein